MVPGALLGVIPADHCGTAASAWPTLQQIMQVSAPASFGQRSHFIRGCLPVSPRSAPDLMILVAGYSPSFSQVRWLSRGISIRQIVYRHKPCAGIRGLDLQSMNWSFVICVNCRNGWIPVSAEKPIRSATGGRWLGQSRFAPVAILST